MIKRKIISGPGFCAVTEDGKLMEYISLDHRDQNGVILLGKIERMMPGLNCAFVDIGRKKKGFLPLSEDSDSFTGSEIRSGETILMQIKKEETGEKGAYMTRDITLPGALTIVMPMNRYIGVSNRIKDEETRMRLKRAGLQIAKDQYGLVIRKTAENADLKAVKEEADRLFSIWQRILEYSIRGGFTGQIYYSDDPLTKLKDDYTSGGYVSVTERDGPDPDICRQLKMTSERILALPNGGNIVIDRCEAMTVIDVNTASSKGNGLKGKSFLETNLEACSIIAQQIRLRNISGIILIDFIDMDDETDRSLVVNRLYECFVSDRIKTVIHGWTRLGLIEMTRKRTGKEMYKKEE